MSLGKWHHRESDEGGYYTISTPTETQYFPYTDDPHGAHQELLERYGVGEGDNIYVNGGVFTVRIAREEDGKDLPNGAYIHRRCEYVDDDERPERLIPSQLRNDYFVPTNYYEQVITEITGFINSKQVYNDIGAHYSRGILLYGEPGEGKSAIIRAAAREIIEGHGGLMVVVEKLPTIELMRNLRASVQDRPLLFVLEELVSIMAGARSQTTMQLLNLLDGVDTPDNMITIATTNYPGELPANLVDRPGRFDLVLKVGEPELPTLQKIATQYMGREITEDEAKILKPFGIAHVREICLMSRIRGMPFDECAQKLKEVKRQVKGAFADQQKIGFGSHGGREW